VTDCGTVEIRRKGKGFRVVCVPPDPLHPPADFTDGRAAFGCAGGIRMTTGRRKVDLTGA
jgi:hypothetical protein